MESILSYVGESVLVKVEEDFKRLESNDRTMNLRNLRTKAWITGTLEDEETREESSENNHCRWKKPRE